MKRDKTNPIDKQLFRHAVFDQVRAGLILHLITILEILLYLPYLIVAVGIACFYLYFKENIDLFGALFHSVVWITPIATLLLSYDKQWFSGANDQSNLIAAAKIYIRNLRINGVISIAIGALLQYSLYLAGDTIYAAIYGKWWIAWIVSIIIGTCFNIWNEYDRLVQMEEEARKKAWEQDTSKSASQRTWQTEQGSQGSSQQQYRDARHTASNTNQGHTNIFANATSPAEAKRLYRQLAKKYHPDMNTGMDPTMFIVIQNDYDEYLKTSR